MYSQRYKYPRTPHLSFSPGVGKDDFQLDRDRLFANCQIVVTEKLDGENTTLYRDYIHSRSLDSRHHPSRAWVKALLTPFGLESGVAKALAACSQESGVKTSPKLYVAFWVRIFLPKSRLV